MSSLKEQKAKILLVEDDENDVQLFNRVMRKEFPFVEVQSILNPERVLELLESDQLLAMDPTFIVMDIKMPKISGLQILEKIRDRKDHARLPVVIMSSSNQESDIQRAYELCANSFVPKPTSYTNLKKHSPS